jgi:hypothetical protein
MHRSIWIYGRLASTSYLPNALDEQRMPFEMKVGGYWATAMKASKLPNSLERILVNAPGWIQIEAGGDELVEQRIRVL